MIRVYGQFIQAVRYQECKYCIGDDKTNYMAYEFFYFHYYLVTCTHISIILWDAMGFI